MVGVVVIEVHMPACRSLKDKRSVLRPVIEGLRTRHPATVAEVGHQDLHQRAVIEVAVAGSSARVVGDTLDAIERQVWSHGGLEVIAARRRWSEDE